MTANGCGKARFTTERAARTALRRIRADTDGQPEPRPVRPYHCSRCHLWHLTSKADWKHVRIRHRRRRKDPAE